MNKASLALIYATFAWGSSFLILKSTSTQADPSFVIFARLAIACVCFLLLYPKLRGVRYHRGDWKYFLMIAAGEPCLYFIFESQAVRFATASQVGAINALMPIFVAILAWLFIKEKLSPRLVVGLVISVIGAILLNAASTPSESATNPTLGMAFESLAMLSSGMYAIALKKISARYSALFLTATQTFIGCLFFLALAISKGAMQAPLESTWWIGVAYLGIGVSFLGYLCYNWAISKTSVTAAAMFANLVPIFALILDTTFSSDRPSGYQSTAILVLIIGVSFSQIEFKSWKISLSQK